MQIGARHSRRHPQQHPQPSFAWPAGELQDRTGYNSEQLHVFLGADERSTSIYHNTTVNTNNPGSFSGWQQVNFIFTASATSEVLKVLSDGAPANNLPPVAFLDSVSLTGVPEPATWAIMVLGFGALGAALRRRRRRRRRRLIAPHHQTFQRASLAGRPSSLPSPQACKPFLSPRDGAMTAE